jgi:hypothetical protein
MTTYYASDTILIALHMLSNEVLKTSLEVKVIYFLNYFKIRKLED